MDHNYLEEHKPLHSDYSRVFKVCSKAVPEPGTAFEHSYTSDGRY